MEKQNSKSWFQREAWFKERLILKIKKFRNFENDYHKSVVATVGNCKLDFGHKCGDFRDFNIPIVQVVYSHGL